MMNQQQLSLMQLRRLEQNQLLLEHQPQACTLPPAHLLDLQACAPAAAAARKRGRAAGREGGAAGNQKGGEEERELQNCSNGGGCCSRMGEVRRVRVLC
jgi:hypothetical protein